MHPLSIATLASTIQQLLHTARGIPLLSHNASTWANQSVYTG